MAEVIKPSDLHGIDDARELAQRHDDYLKAMDASIAKGLRGETVIPGMSAPASPLAALENIASNPSLTKEIGRAHV